MLRAWHEQGHRALVFTQTQQMLDIVEKAVEAEGAPPPPPPPAAACMSPAGLSTESGALRRDLSGIIGANAGLGPICAIFRHKVAAGRGDVHPGS